MDGYQGLGKRAFATSMPDDDIRTTRDDARLRMLLQQGERVGDIGRFEVLPAHRPIAILPDACRSCRNLMPSAATQIQPMMMAALSRMPTGALGMTPFWSSVARAMLPMNAMSSAAP